MTIVKEIPRGLPLELTVIDFVSVALQVKSNPWSISFFPKPADPRPVIYHTTAGNDPNLLLPRQVRWQLAERIADDQFLLVVPKTPGTNIFRRTRTLEEEVYRLDNQNPTVLSGPALRGGNGLGELGWVYGVVLMRETERLISFPPSEYEGTPLAYLDPVVVIKDEP